MYNYKYLKEVSCFSSSSSVNEREVLVLFEDESGARERSNSKGGRGADLPLAMFFLEEEYEEAADREAAPSGLRESGKAVSQGSHSRGRVGDGGFEDEARWREGAAAEEFQVVGVEAPQLLGLGVPGLLLANDDGREERFARLSKHVDVPKSLHAPTAQPTPRRACRHRRAPRQEPQRHLRPPQLRAPGLPAIVLS